MPSAPRRGDRAQGAVSPLVLVVGGLVVALVAAVLLALTLRDGQPAAITTATPPATPPVTSAGPATAGDDDARTTGEPSPASGHQASTAPSGQPLPSSGVHGWSASAVPPPVAAPTTTTTTTTGSSPTGTAAATGPAAQPAGAPAWIRIASAAVDGAIVPQGLAPDGTINPGRNEIIWFTGNGRVRPGEVGTSVLAAHVTWEGAPDAFAQLPSVSIGDVVEVGYTDGSSRSFTVTSTAPVDKDALSRSLTVWGPHPGRPRLAIITCDPVLGYQADGHTAANFVVIAEG